MNALVRKEIRLILPPWLAAMALAVAPAWFWPVKESNLWRAGDSGYWVLAVWLAAGLLLPALATFGQEFNLGTFSTLLAQPAARARTWRLKLGVLTTAAAVALAGLIISFGARFGWDRLIWPMAGSALLLAAVALSGGLWATLLLRQTVGAFVFAAFIPLFLTLITVGLLVGNVPDAVGMTCLITLLGGYAAAGFVGARRLYGSAQDTPPLGREISLGRFTMRGAAPKSGTRPWRALVRKEFQLQEQTLFLAVALAGLHLLDLVARRLLDGRFGPHSLTRFFLEAFPALWILLPLVAGSVAVAEERKLGTLEGHLCAPLSRRRQFAIKLAVTLALGVALGCAAPFVLEFLGLVVGASGAMTGGVMGYLPSFDHLILSLTLVALGLTLAAFYASTLSRSTLAALGTTVAVLATLGGFEAVSSNPVYVAGRPMWGTPLAQWIELALLPTMLLVLAWRNFAYLYFGAKIWRRNAMALLGVCVATLAADSIIFNRVWEAWMPEEPFHVWREKEQPQSGPATIVRGENTAVVTPDGRLWLASHGGHFVPESNWMAAAAANFQRFTMQRNHGRGWALLEHAVTAQYHALQRDGSLWDVTESPQPLWPATRWRALAGGEGEGGDGKFIGLRIDGSLWTWEPGYRDPRKFGPATNWVLIASDSVMTAAAKTDGSIWRWGFVGRKKEGSVTKVLWTNTPQRWIQLTGRKPVSLSLNNRTVAILCDDHSLWVGGGPEDDGELLRLGDASGWKAAAMISPFGVAALTMDGSLWRLRVPFFKQPFQQERLSAYHLWVGVAWGGNIENWDSQFYNSALAIASDGKLCRWKAPFGWDSVEWSQSLNSSLVMAPSRLKAFKVVDLGKFATGSE